MSKIKKLYETSNIEEIKKLINDDNFKNVTLSKNYCDDLEKIIKLMKILKMKQILFILNIDVYLIAWK